MTKVNSSTNQSVIPDSSLGLDNIVLGSVDISISIEFGSSKQAENEYSDMFIRVLNVDTNR